MFQSGYSPHGVPLIYDGEEIALNPQAEEVANFWCAALGSDYPGKPKFMENFWAAFLCTFPEDDPFLTSGFKTSELGDSLVPRKKRKGLADEHKPVFEKADFTRIQAYLEDVKAAEKETKKNLDKTERETERLRRLKVHNFTQ